MEIFSPDTNEVSVMRKFFLLLAVTLAGAGFNMLSGQVITDDYISHVKHNALIFSGSVAQKYPFVHNGTYYVFNDVFHVNDLYYNGKLYKGVELNLNANSDELVVKVPESGKNVILNRDMVEWFTLDSKRFIGVKDGKYEDLPGGYYEVLYEGDGLVLRKITKLLKERVEGQKIAYSFIPIVKRYIIRDGVAYPVKKVGELTRIYRERKQDIRGFLKEQGRLFSSKGNLDNGLVAVMEFVEQN